MSELENIQDRIDEYIRGTMSAKDRTIFEEMLRQDADLRHEVEVQVSISDAVQAVHLKQVLRDVEAGLHPTKAKQNTFPIGRYPFWRQFAVWAFAAVAVALLLVTGNTWRNSQRIKGFGNEYYAMLTAPISRDGNTLDELMSSCYALIGVGDFEVAQTDLDALQQKLSEILAEPTTNEESEYRHKLVQEKQYESDWYQVIILMKQGKYRKVKPLLLSIGQSDSPYAVPAQKILGEMYNINFQ